MKKTTIFSALTVLALASASQAALVAGWNNVPDQWEFENNNNAATQLNYSSTAGVTEGTHSLQLEAKTGFSLLAKTFGPDFNNALIAAGTATSPVIVSVDITIPAGSFDVGGSYFEVNFPYTGEQTGFTNVLVQGVGFPGQGTQTISFTLPAGVRGNNPSFFGMWIGLNTDRAPGSGLAYFDNFQVTAIPEPTSLGLVGALGLGLLARRR